MWKTNFHLATVICFAFFFSWHNSARWKIFAENFYFLLKNKYEKKRKVFECSIDVNWYNLKAVYTWRMSGWKILINSTCSRFCSLFFFIAFQGNFIHILTSLEKVSPLCVAVDLLGNLLSVKYKKKNLTTNLSQNVKCFLLIGSEQIWVRYSYSWKNVLLKILLSHFIRLWIKNLKWNCRQQVSIAS